MRDRDYRGVAQTLVWLLPASPLKNRLLRRLGHRVDATAYAGQCLVWRVPYITLEDGSRVSSFSMIKNLSELHLGPGSLLAGYNLVSSHPVFVRLYNSGGSLVLSEQAAITTRHTLDCSGGVTLGPFSLIAGHGTQVLSHSIDLRRNAQSARPVSIGERSFVGSGCVILGGGGLPARSVLAAGSVLVGSGECLRGGLYAGVPARWKSEIGGDWFDRSTEATRDVFIPDGGTTITDAF